eukprot:gene141-4387_t
MKKMADMMKMMKDPKLMGQMTETMNILNNMKVCGSAGNNLVKTEMNGQGFVESVEIDEKILTKENKKQIENLVRESVNDARNQVNQQLQSQMQNKE